MKNAIALAALAATTLFAAPAFAQAKNFEGFSIGLNGDWINATSGYTSTSGAVSESVSQNSINIGLQGQYNIVLGQQWVLGLGAAYELTKARVGTYASGAELTTNNMTSVYIAPGYAISNTALLYGKFASVGATSECGAGCAETTFAGYGVGVGVQTLLNKNWLMQAEFLNNKYDDKVSNSATNNAKSTTISVGMGYKF